MPPILEIALVTVFGTLLLIALLERSWRKARMPRWAEPPPAAATYAHQQTSPAPLQASPRRVVRDCLNRPVSSGLP